MSISHSDYCGFMDITRYSRSAAAMYGGPTGGKLMPMRCVSVGPRYIAAAPW